MIKLEPFNKSKWSPLFKKWTLYQKHTVYFNDSTWNFQQIETISSKIQRDNVFKDTTWTFQQIKTISSKIQGDKMFSKIQLETLNKSKRSVQKFQVIMSSGAQKRRWSAGPRVAASSSEEGSSERRHECDTNKWNDVCRPAAWSPIVIGADDSQQIVDTSPCSCVLQSSCDISPGFRRSSGKYC